MRDPSISEMGKWCPEDDTGGGEGGGRQEEREERENLMTSSLNAWNGDSDKGKLLVCVRDSRMEGHELP